MGSSNLGQLGNGRYWSSRKGKKSSSDKRKQPQRELGVAQSENIGLQSDMLLLGYSSLLHSPFVGDLNKVGFGGSSGTEIRYGGLHPGATSRPLHDENDLLLPLHLLQPIVTLPLIEQSLENNRRRCDSISQNSDSSNSSELDLELTLSP
ncbi:hypothetical protein MUK42_11662 [Musa troglodytarum]|uniref:Uncharacterized protein n=1 Tax=Musa troglodytarum TaxID=320322 RepID=A0A9E7KJ24_9LILI|nr:hypothetical protein MUK42_11662 [Musa troglodytarum]